MTVKQLTRFFNVLHLLVLKGQKIQLDMSYCKVKHYVSPSNLNINLNVPPNP